MNTATYYEIGPTNIAKVGPYAPLTSPPPAPHPTPWPTSTHIDPRLSTHIDLTLDSD